MPKEIKDFPAETTPQDTDELLIQSSGITKKITRANFLFGISSGGGGGNFDFIQLLHTVASGTNGGTSSSGWNDRLINSIAADDTGLVTLSSNRFILPAGDYIINCSASFYRPYEVQLRLYNYTDSATIIPGILNYIGNLDASTITELSGKFTIGASKELAIQYRANNSVANIGLGLGANFGINNVFLTCNLFKV